MFFAETQKLLVMEKNEATIFALGPLWEIHYTPYCSEVQRPINIRILHRKIVF